MPNLIEPGRCFVIAEVAQAHDGSLGTAHAFVDAVAGAGADAIKFQTHIASAESTPAEPWRVKFSYQDDTRFNYWRRMEFAADQWRGLKKHAEDRGLVFLSSPFSLEAVELLADLGIVAWKIASGEVTNQPMIQRMCATGSPILLSSGMSPLCELDRLVEQIRSAHCDLTLFQCTSAYPCPADQVGLNMLAEYRNRYGCHVGLSDHSGRIFPGLAAAALGADALEVHVTLSREMFGPDVKASVTTAELHQLVDGVRFVEAMLAHPVSKDAMAATMAPMRSLFVKSIVATHDMEAGTVLSQTDLALKKPGTGLPADRMTHILGKRLVRSIKTDAQLSENDVE